MPRHIPYNAYVPWGPFQDFETNYEQVVVPWPQTPGMDNYLDGIQYPSLGSPQRHPGHYHNRALPGQGYAPYQRYPGHGYGAPAHSGHGSMIRFPLPTHNLDCLDNIRLPALGQVNVRLPSGQVRLPSGAVAMPWHLEYAEEAGVRMPTLEGIRMPGDAACAPQHDRGLLGDIRMPQLSVLGNSFCNVRMPSPSFQTPNPGFRMHVLPRPVISIENALGINVGSTPRGWDPSSEWYFPDTCVPHSVLGRVTTPLQRMMP
jgi:hypothetical protein